jgi:hypothetical protein
LRLTCSICALGVRTGRWVVVQVWVARPREKIERMMADVAAVDGDASDRLRLLIADAEALLAEIEAARGARSEGESTGATDLTQRARDLSIRPAVLRRRSRS